MSAAAMTVALHTCCGPCSSSCVPRLKELGHDVVMFFANSNIDSKQEFMRRLVEAQKVADAEGVKLVALKYDHEEWLREVAAGLENEPERGERCAKCFRYSLGKTMQFAKEMGIGAFTTTLTVSPHKDTKVIFREAGLLPYEPGAPKFLEENFKKHDGFAKSMARSTELGLYRQKFCGCEFSIRPPKPKKPRVPKPATAPEGATADAEAEAASPDLLARPAVCGLPPT